MKQHERLQAEEEIELLGFWTARRITVCHGCDRYKVTDYRGVCRRCTTAALEDEPELEAAA